MPGMFSVVINRERLENALLILLAIFVIFGQRFVIPIAGNPIPIVIFFVFFAIIVWYFLGSIKIEASRFLLYFFAISGLTLSAAISIRYSQEFSYFSIVYLLILYAPLVFVFKNFNKLDLLLYTFQIGMLIAAVIGIVQFLSQLIGIPYRDVLSSISKQFVDQKFHHSIVITKGSSLYKANGIFFLEPAHFSKWLSIAILVEVYHFRNFKRLLVFIPALLLSFSGTGILALSVGLIPVLRHLNVRQVFRLSFVMILVLLVFFASGFAQVHLKRVVEFTNPKASAYIRFIAPNVTYYNYFQNAEERALFGEGPGSVDQELERGVDNAKQSHSSMFIKLLYEYGFVGLTFLVFILYSFFSKSFNRVLALVLFFTYSILSTGLLNPQTLYLCYAIGMLFIIPSVNDSVVSNSDKQRFVSKGSS